MSPEGRVRYTYTENASKNRSGGVAQLDVSHKVVHQFTHPELGERCHVFILDKYLAKIPDSVKLIMFALLTRHLKVTMLHGFLLWRLAKTSSAKW